MILNCERIRADIYYCNKYNYTCYELPRDMSPLNDHGLLPSRFYLVKILSTYLTTGIIVQVIIIFIALSNLVIIFICVIDCFDKLLSLMNDLLRQFFQHNTIHHVY